MLNYYSFTISVLCLICAGCDVNPPDRTKELSIYALLTNDTCPQFQLQNDQLTGIQENTVAPSSAAIDTANIDVTGIRIHSNDNSLLAEFKFNNHPVLTDLISNNPNQILQEYILNVNCSDINLSMRAFVFSSERKSMNSIEDIPVELLENGVRKGTCGTLRQTSDSLIAACPIAQGLSDPFQCSYRFRVSYTASNGQRYGDCR